MSVHKRGSTWRYSFTINKVRYRASVPEARTKREAVEAENQVRRSVYEGTFQKRSISEIGTTLLSTFIDEVFVPWSKANKRSWANDVYRGRVLCDYFRGKRFCDITPMLIEQFKIDRANTATKHGGTRSRDTVNRELQLLSSVFTKALDNNLVLANPCLRVRKFRTYSQRDRVLSVTEEARLMAQLKGRYAHIKPVVVIALHTAMRRGEILGLEWADVDFTRNVIRIPGRKTKSGKERTIPMNSVVRNELDRLASIDPDARFVFPGRAGYSIGDIKHSFTTARRKAGIPDFRFHDLRHSAATRMADAGIDVRSICEILGHATIQLTMRYAHATDDAKRRVTEALERYALSDTPVHSVAGGATCDTDLPQICPTQPKNSSGGPGGRP